jgi:peptidoglycan/LPS O-acetylase OafA/YrhL
VGVQLFFALSGFLITRILLRSRGAPGWIRAFYVRRVLRIVPLYYVTLAVVFGLAPHVGALSAIAARGPRSTLWYWSYLSNWVAPYGGLAAALPHVWSLAVEEQYYLVWPFLVAAFSDRLLAVTCVLMFVGAAAARVVIHATLPTKAADQAAYMFTITRCDTIAMGALVALAMRSERATDLLRKLLMPLTAAAVTALIVAILSQRSLAPQGRFAEPMNMPLTAILSSLVLAACVLPPAAAGQESSLQTIMVRTLSARWLQFVGQRSYAIYIFHMTLNIGLQSHVAPLLEAGGPGHRFIAIVGYTLFVFVVSTLLAVVSWRMLEEPALSLKRYFPMPTPSRGMDQVDGSSGVGLPRVPSATVS